MEKENEGGVRSSSLLLSRQKQGDTMHKSLRWILKGGGKVKLKKVQKRPLWDAALKKKKMRVSFQKERFASFRAI